MNVNFRVLSASTVPSNYSWDKGTPLANELKTLAYTSTNYTSGYSPALKVYFQNTSKLTNDYDILIYEWDFGDYYNTSLTLTQSSFKSDCFSNNFLLVNHTYIMPGKYNVKLTSKQIKQTSITKSISASVIKNEFIELKEIPPVAKIDCVTQPVYGFSPLTIRFSPQYCVSGSFPIERIDWDFNDGTEIKTITRYSQITGDSDLIFTNRFSQDPLDVRNYDIIHTFIRHNNDYPVFYPSLSCYASNTNTHDSCSTTIGPLFLSASPQTLNLVKTRNNTDGNLYIFDVNQTLSFQTNLSSEVNITIKTPPNKIRNAIKTENTEYIGNSGSNFLT